MTLVVIDYNPHWTNTEKKSKELLVLDVQAQIIQT